MPFQHFTLTMTGSAITLSTVLPEGQPTVSNYLALQADASNSNVIYIGGVGQTLSSSAYGQRVEAPVNTVPPAATIFETAGVAPVRLDQIQVLGTNTEKLHITVIN